MASEFYQGETIRFNLRTKATAPVNIQDYDVVVKFSNSLDTSTGVSFATTTKGDLENTTVYDDKGKLLYYQISGAIPNSVTKALPIGLYLADVLVAESGSTYKETSILHGEAFVLKSNSVYNLVSGSAS